MFDPGRDEMSGGRLAIFGGKPAVTEKSPPWPYFTDEDIEAVRRGMLKGREDWTWACTAAGGELTERLEREFAEWLGRKYVISTSSGGAALHIACMAAGIQLGDEVITTPFSWGQTSSCILQAGGIPIFADIHPETLTIDPEKIEPLITERTKAIVLVHIGGIPADMDAIMAIAERHDLIVIEDCAQAQGSLYRGRQVGTFGHLGCFSVGSGKNMAVSEGGFIATDDRDLYERALLAGMHPGRLQKEITLKAYRERIDSLIYTYRMNALSAAMALNQLRYVHERNEWRRRNVAKLRELLKGVPGIRPLNLPEHLDPAWHMVHWTFVPEDLPGVTREQYIKALQAEGVPISGSYVGTPIHLRYTFLRKEWWLGKGYPWRANPKGDEIVYRTGDCPVAERRCFEQDIVLGGGAWWRDVTPLLEGIAEAFHKVTAQPQRLREVP